MMSWEGRVDISIFDLALILTQTGHFKCLMEKSLRVRPLTLSATRHLGKIHPQRLINLPGSLP